MNGGRGSDAAHDAIGGTYREYRRPDARIAGAITRALGDARTAVNVGAGAGAYEPRDRSVVAVEPSLTMIRQRPGGQRAHRAGVGAPTPIQGRHLRGGAGGVDRAPLARACPEPHRARARGARSRCRRDLGSIERRVLAHRRVFPGDRGDRPTDLPDDGGASTDTRPRGGSTTADSPRLLGRIFSERTGAGPGRISTRAFGAPSRRARSFETASLAWSVCGRTSRTAPGSDATGTS